MSRSGQKTANTRAKIAFPSTGPKVRLSTAAERLSPSRKYCSFGTVTGRERLRRDVVELHLVDEDGAVAAVDHVARPGGDSQHEHAVVGVAIGNDRAVVGLGGVYGDDLAGIRIGQNRYVTPCASTRPSQRGNRVGHRLRVVGFDRNEDLGEVENDERCDGDDHDGERAVIQRSMAATLPRAAVAAPACFFLHAGRGLRSRQLGGDA